MQIEPAADAFGQTYAAGHAQVVWTTLVAALETPVSAFLKLATRRPLSFLLESVEGGATRGRYSIIGLDPDVVWRANGAQAEIETPVAELIDFGGVTSQQGRFVKAGIEHVGPQPHGGGRRRDRRQYGKRCRRAEVVGQMQGIESEILQAPCLVLQCTT